MSESCKSREELGSAAPEYARGPAPGVAASGRAAARLPNGVTVVLCDSRCSVKHKEEQVPCSAAWALA